MATAPQMTLIAPADFDRWRAARTENAQSIIGYTAIEQLFEDFATWAYAAIGLTDPDPASFRAALETAPKPLIRIEKLQCRAYYRAPRMADCASLTLRAPIWMA